MAEEEETIEEPAREKDMEKPAQEDGVGGYHGGAGGVGWRSRPLNGCSPTTEP